MSAAEGRGRRREREMGRTRNAGAPFTPLQKKTPPATVGLQEIHNRDVSKVASLTMTAPNF